MARILITEDEDSLRAFVARALRMDGHETVEAADGAEGLEALDGGRFDLLLSDIRMPVMDGIELTHRASAAHPALKILLIDDILESGRTLSFARDLMLERGARHVSIAVLLDKHDKRKTSLEADFVGFKCPDHFVVGYGMDVAYAFRELPFVGVVTGDANSDT